MRGKKEAVPLLSHNRMTSTGKKKSGLYNPAFNTDLEDVVREKEYWEDDFDEDRVLFADDKKRGTMLIWNDFCILTVEYIQYLALVQSLALRWPWPENWIKYMSWLFAFNLDAWEISKVSSNMTYKSVQEFSSDSTLMLFSYWHFLVALGTLLFCLALAYVVAYIVLSKRDDPFMMIKISNLQRVYIIMIQILALPIGLAIGKVFHCVLDPQQESFIMYVDNTQQCYGDVQWAYAAGCFAFAILTFKGFAFWLIKKTKKELIFSHASGHEAYLQLKETEYAQGLDIVYIISGFHIFSSFKLRAAHFRAANHLLKLVLVLFYASLFNHSLYQTMMMTIVILIYFIAFAILRPFRVKVFNGVLMVNTFCLMANMLTGALRTSFDVYSVRSVWFTPSYTTSVLLIVNGGWLVFTLAVLAYLLLHQFNCIRQPIWPSLTSEGVEKLDENTKKFMRAVLRARHIVERSMSLPALFAPAHELSRQIQIINAYCREAELLDDPLQDTLWHLLDELIEVHAQIAPRSLFSESVKESIRTTAADLMRIMPMFVKRLAQREYDLLLISPLKRRILLKLFCMGMFLNGRAKKVELKKMNKKAMKKLWNEDRAITTQTMNYIGVLQPEREFSELGPRVAAAQGNYTNPLIDIDEFSDEDSLILDDSDLGTSGAEVSAVVTSSRQASADHSIRSGRLRLSSATITQPEDTHQPGQATPEEPAKSSRSRPASSGTEPRAASERPPSATASQGSNREPNVAV